MNSRQEEYAQFIKKLQEQNYSFISFPEAPRYKDSDHTCLLRHDVDVSLEAAETLSSIESDLLGISSTFFIMISCPLYNIHSKEGRRRLQNISRRHHIGLHFDCSIYHDLSQVNLNEYVQAECDALQLPVTAVSFHCPGSFELERAALRNHVHTYEPQFTKSSYAYFADSGGKWRYGNPLESSEFKSGQNLHILIHPMWWLMKGNQKDVLEEYCRRHGKHASEYFGEYFPRVWSTV